MMKVQSTRAPFGIAEYPDYGRRMLGSLPHIRATQVLNDSQYGLIEDTTRRGQSRLVTNMYDAQRDVQRGSDFFSDRALQRRAGRGIAGRETTSVQRRSTTVERSIADAIMLEVLQARRHMPRVRLAQSIGISPRQVHLAELGCVQPQVLLDLARYFQIDITPSRYGCPQ